jgi:molybdenum cofactor cytidylyltransferase
MVLAAGESTRMGAPKALLPDGDGRTFISRILHTFSAAGLRDLTVVTGTMHAAIVDAVARDAPIGAFVTFARNPEPSRGQLSSLITGLDAVDRPGVLGALVTLVDIPFIAPSTVSAVLAAHGASGAPIVRPARGGRHGHPVLFGRALFEELRRADPGRGAKAVVQEHAGRVVNVEIADDGAFIDLDTREDYERVVRS